MTTIPSRPDDSIPLIVGYVYKFGNAFTGSNYVIITDIVDNVVFARGIGDTQADIEVPKYRFDDMVAGPGYPFLGE